MILRVDVLREAHLLDPMCFLAFVLDVSLALVHLNTKDWEFVTEDKAPLLTSD